MRRYALEKQTCPLCGSEISALFDLEEHQKAETCKAMQRYNKLHEDGWRPLLPHHAALAGQAELPIRTIMIPDRALKRSVNGDHFRFVAMRKWDGLAHDKLLIISIAPAWVVEIIETAETQCGPNTDGKKHFGPNQFHLGPRALKLLRHLRDNEEERGVYLTAMRLGGIKRACEMFEGDSGA